MIDIDASIVEDPPNATTSHFRKHSLAVLG
jgi:hypothetical protein